MKKLLLPAVVSFLLLSTGCIKEKITSKNKDVVYAPQHITQPDMTGKRDGCLINVGAVATYSPTEWVVNVSAENPEPNHKSMLITVLDNASATILEQEIEKIPQGWRYFGLSFSSTSGGPWSLTIRSYNSSHIPKDLNTHCGLVNGTLQLPPPCIDPSQICSVCVCTQDYNPVCGCNNVTYTNSCEAQKAGVTSWTVGSCVF